MDEDGDGMGDNADASPNDPEKAEDDGDDDSKKDTDGDGVADSEDAFPNDPSESKDLDLILV